MNKLRPLYINDSILEQRGACQFGLRTFRTEFGHGVDVPVTLENLRRAYLAGLPGGWLAATYGEATGVATHDMVNPSGRCVSCLMYQRIHNARDMAAKEWKEIRDIQRKAEKRGFYANAA